ncbi:recombinase family protein [Pseudoalteromonas sp. SG41-1]|uniref:recombinase family protein n=1 Tax=Pseudoalteromonas sp. SG41-1 TaxID=2760979 RepID=UPI0015FEFEA3|nr:recombinase family protein [Pseudoalteromonas sp. SG41-1]MBB1505768.1 recombinase family protein [Pseudoalteromonas sp. SG41-1]
MKKMEEFSKTKPPVVSYIRWSTGGQKLGDSEKRQLEKSREWLKKNGYEIDEEIVLEDSGLSGFHEENFGENSALTKFIAKVKAGVFPRGTKLIIEDFSRFSRAEVMIAQAKFIELLEIGINIVIVKDEREYSKDNYKTMDIIYSLLKMEAAHDESKRKSEYLHSVWKSKVNQVKETAEQDKEKYPVYITSNCPDWLIKVKLDKYDKQKYYEVIEERKKIIEYIFYLADKGGDDGLGLGSTTIVRQLNKEGIQPFKGEKQNIAGNGTFTDSYILRLLNDKRVIGYYQPHNNPINKKTGKRQHIPYGDPIPNYFPPIISEEIFNRVQQKKEQRKVYQSGKVSQKFTNLFTKIVKCSYCGAPMTLFRKRGSKAENFICYYLQCSEGTKLQNKEHCGNKSVRYHDTFEKTIMTILKEINIASLFKSKDDKYTQQELSLRNRSYDISVEIEEKIKLLKNITKLLVQDPDDDYIKQERNEMLEEKRQLELKVEDINQQLVSLRNSHSYDNFKDNLDFVLKTVNPNDEVETYNKRRAINTYLMDVIQYIAVDGVNKQSWIVFDLGFVKDELSKAFQRGQDYLANATRDENGQIIDHTHIPDDDELRAFGTNAISPHIKVKHNRYKVTEPDSHDKIILREAFDIAPPELIRINKKVDKAVNRTWKHLRRKHYRVLDMKAYEELQESLINFDALSTMVDDEEVERMIREENERLNKS